MDWRDQGVVGAIARRPRICGRHGREGSRKVEIMQTRPSRKLTRRTLLALSAAAGTALVACGRPPAINPTAVPAKEPPAAAPAAAKPAEAPAAAPTTAAQAAPTT